LEDAAGEQAPLVRQWFEQQVYNRQPIDDRVEPIETAEIVPEAGIFMQRDGTRAERTPEEAKNHIKEARDAFRKAHPDAKPSQPGPFPWRSIVQVRRYAAHVPQTLVVKFEAGTTETLNWPEDERWHRYV